VDETPQREENAMEKESLPRRRVEQLFLHENNSFTNNLALKIIHMP